MWHKKSRRKISGGKKKTARKQKKHQLGRESISCKLSDDSRRKTIGTRGNDNKKTRLRFANSVNVAHPKEGKVKEKKIKNVIKTPSNPHFARRNILTKGTIIETGTGKAKITSRPGQDGQANAVKIQ